MATLFRDPFDLKIEAAKLKQHSLGLMNWVTARIESPLGAIALLGEGLAAALAAALDEIASDEDFARQVERICKAVAEHASECRKALRNRGDAGEIDSSRH